MNLEEHTKGNKDLSHQQEGQTLKTTNEEPNQWGAQTMSSCVQVLCVRKFIFSLCRWVLNLVSL